MFSNILKNESVSKGDSGAFDTDTIRTQEAHDDLRQMAREMGLSESEIDATFPQTQVGKVS